MLLLKSIEAKDFSSPGQVLLKSCRGRAVRIWWISRTSTRASICVSSCVPINGAHRAWAHTLSLPLFNESCTYRLLRGIKRHTRPSLSPRSGPTSSWRIWAGGQIQDAHELVSVSSVFTEKKTSLAKKKCQPPNLQLLPANSAAWFETKWDLVQQSLS